MVAFTTLICDRQTRLHFSNGEIVGDMKNFTVTDFRTRAHAGNTPGAGQQLISPPQSEGEEGHGGGDIGLISSFVRAVRAGRQEILGTNIDEILKSHLSVFAAEISRREGRVVDVLEFEKDAREKYLGNGNMIRT